jgi:hypothetical protein
MGEHWLDRHCYQMRIIARTIPWSRLAVSTRDNPRKDHSHTYLKSSRLRDLLGTTLTITLAIAKVNYLNKDEERVIGVHTYRILIGTYVSIWTPAFLNFCRANNACSSAEKGKFIVLVKLRLHPKVECCRVGCCRLQS